ncbi:MAG: hypothetical protein LWX83_11790 [Anaerolineae bacterium]|nr:hypothetical protein [Anaerolineae bacterium]
MKSPVSTVIAILTGIVVLLASFLAGLSPQLQSIRVYLVGWAATLIGVAALIGILNLVSSHWKRLFSPEKKDFYSLFLIVAFLLSAAAGLFFTPADSNYQKIVTALQVPLETSLLAVLSVSLAMAAFRLLQRRRNFMGIVFVASFIVFLIIGSGIAGSVFSLPFIGPLLNLLPLAGARGLLLGIGLASLTAGLRILFGADRPYSG